MRYCRAHERAWHPPGATFSEHHQTKHVWQPGYWAPLHPDTLRLALKMAQEFGCLGQITLEEAPCDVCVALGERGVA